MCRNSCLRPTVRRVFRHLVALLCFFFFFAHILLLVRITSYAIFISIPISISFACCARARQRGGGGERTASAELNLFGVCSAVDVIVDETLLLLTPLSGVASSLLSLSPSLPALDRRQLALLPYSPSSLVYLPSFCCPCIASFFNQFVLC